MTYIRHWLCWMQTMQHPHGCQHLAKQWRRQTSNLLYTISLLVERLTYLTITRLDNIFVVHKLSHFLAHPLTAHLAVAHKILHHLKFTLGQEILFPSNSATCLQAFSDSNWGAFLDTRWFDMILHTPQRLTYFVKTKKQFVVSQSSGEAKYCALTNIGSKLIWLSHLLQYLDNAPIALAIIYYNNQVVIHITNNPTFHEQTKHNEMDCLFVLDKV